MTLWGQLRRSRLPFLLPPLPESGESLAQELGALQFEWQHSTHGGSLAHVMTFAPIVGTEVDPVTPRHMMVRALCHVLIDSIPTSELPDVFSSLHSTYEFYLPKPQPVMMAIRRVTAKKGRTFERAVFHAEED